MVFLPAAGACSGADHLAHGSKIVDAPTGADDEFAIVRLLHLAVFPDDHGGHVSAPWNVRISNTRCAWAIGQTENLLQFFLNGFGVGLSTRKRWS